MNIGLQQVAQEIPLSLLHNFTSGGETCIYPDKKSEGVSNQSVLVVTVDSLCHVFAILN